VSGLENIQGGLDGLFHLASNQTNSVNNLGTVACLGRIPVGQTLARAIVLFVALLFSQPSFAGETNTARYGSCWTKISSRKRSMTNPEVVPRGALRSELLAALRQARTARRPRARGTDRRGQIPNMTPMAERPAQIATHTVPGHWEGDLIKRARNGSAVGTLVERTTRLVLLARMDGTDARSAREGFTKTLRHMPALLRKTLTYGRGKEMAEHERLAERLAIQIFFADPYSPWQRDTNENTNRLLRQYLHKGTDLSGYTQRELNAIAHRLNTRPRKCLNFATPLEVYAQLRHHSPVALGT
jgi:transposase, IS30 family